MIIADVIEEKRVLPYLKARSLFNQYQKAKKYILLGLLKEVNFKLREPKENGVYSFRINKQFRAFCIFRNNKLVVINISNHQN